MSTDSLNLPYELACSPTPPAVRPYLVADVSLVYDPRRPQVRLKRLMDASVALLALIALIPCLAVIALAIKLSSSGPILFSQDRVAGGGKVFKLFKFRTMVPNAEAMKASLAAMNESDGPVFKIKRDPRVTAVGRFLRKHSLDELPQLWNVVVGDMSIVGPRPPVPEEVRRYRAEHLRRLSVPQGLTCIWQVSGRSNISFEEWMRMDMAYIDSWSIRQDLSIILKTFKVVIQGSGAY